jgi:AcrR family transcriptional regulator
MSGRTTSLTRFSEASLAKPQKRPDRRVQRTRQLLQDALIALTIEKGYEDTTVQDIIDRANVGRATFYAHFADKETLLSSRLEDLRALLEQRQRQGTGLGYSLAMLEHARGHLKLYAAIIGRTSGAYVLQRVHRMIADLARRDLKTLEFNGTPQQKSLAAEYIAGAFMAVLTWWLDQGAQLTPEEVDAIFRRLVTRGLVSSREA